MRSALTVPGKVDRALDLIAISIDDDELAARVGGDEQPIAARRRHDGADGVIELKRRSHLQRSATKRRRATSRCRSTHDRRLAREECAVRREPLRCRSHRCQADARGARRRLSPSSVSTSSVPSCCGSTSRARCGGANAPIAGRREARDAAVRRDAVDGPAVDRRRATSALRAWRRRRCPSADRSGPEARCDRRTRSSPRPHRTRAREPARMRSAADVQMTESSLGYRYARTAPPLRGMRRMIWSGPVDVEADGASCRAVASRRSEGPHATSTNASTTVVRTAVS